MRVCGTRADIQLGIQFSGDPDRKQAALGPVRLRPEGFSATIFVVTPKPAERPSDSVRAEQAARIAAMFERWAAEDVSEEPDWDVEQIERIRFSAPPDAIEHPAP